ncbi:MAG: restriction endonuclease [Burkholderiaceae bacterium]
MRYKPAPNSLFAILLRSPWWISFAVAAVIVTASKALLPENLWIYGAMGCFPFVVIGFMAAWKQLRAPSSAQVQALLDKAASSSWKDFSASLEAGLRKDGGTVTRMPGPAADFEVVKGARTALVSAKRWKAANHGVEPLRELHEAMRARDASESIYVSLGALSDNAARFAKANNVRVLQGAELAQLLKS